MKQKLQTSLWSRKAEEAENSKGLLTGEMKADKRENVRVIHSAVSNTGRHECTHTTTLLLHSEAHNTACLSAFIQKKGHKIIGSVFGYMTATGKQTDVAKISIYRPISVHIPKVSMREHKKKSCNLPPCSFTIHDKSSFTRDCGSVLTPTGFSAEQVHISERLKAKI